MSVWVHDGWRRVRAEPGFDRHVIASIELGLPARPPCGTAHDANEPPDTLGVMFYHRLPDIFPELTWLFGCEAMKAASALTAT